MCALIASAESLFSAAAVDRLHRGPRTDYDRELIAQDAGNVVRVLGNATFLRLPKLLEALEALPHDRDVRLELGGLRHVDHACAAALEGWAAARGHEPVETVGTPSWAWDQGRVATSSMTS